MDLCRLHWSCFGTLHEHRRYFFQLRTHRFSIYFARWRRRCRCSLRRCNLRSCCLNSLRVRFFEPALPALVLHPSGGVAVATSPRRGSPLTPIAVPMVLLSRRPLPMLRGTLRLSAASAIACLPAAPFLCHRESNMSSGICMLHNYKPQESRMNSQLSVGLQMKHYPTRGGGVGLRLCGPFCSILAPRE